MFFRPPTTSLLSLFSTRRVISPRLLVTSASNPGVISILNLSLISIRATANSPPSASSSNGNPIANISSPSRIFPLSICPPPPSIIHRTSNSSRVPIRCAPSSVTATSLAAVLTPPLASATISPAVLSRIKLPKWVTTAPAAAWGLSIAAFLSAASAAKIKISWSSASPTSVRAARGVARKKSSSLPPAHVSLIVPFHQPLSGRPTDGPHRDSRDHIRHVVITPVNRRHAHRCKKRQANPVEPRFVSSRRQQRHHRSRHVRRRERRSVHPAEMLHQFNRRREWSAHERRRIQRRQRKIWTLDRKQYGDDVHRIVRDSRRGHHRPDSGELFFEIQDPRQNHQIQKIGHVGKLHRVIHRGARELRQPNRWMHLRQVEIELDQPAIEPAGKNRMHQPLQLFKEENVERQGIPVPGELHRNIPRVGGPISQQRDAHANPKM